MQWTENISVGVPMIDNRHKELINRLNGLRAAIRKQVCRYIIDDMIAFLEEYVDVHFCEEEQYMQYYRYEHYASHKEQHENFATELHFLKEELRNIRTLGLKGSYELSVETVQVVVDWIDGHVASDDQNLGNFLKQQSNLNHDVILSLCRGKENIIDGILMVCSHCRKIRGRKGLWKHKEHFGKIPSDIFYSHGICPECLQTHYADLLQEMR